MRPHILHVVTGLGLGGAELFLCNLLEGLRDRYRATVVPLLDHGCLTERVRGTGADVRPLAAERGSLGHAARRGIGLRRLAGELSPDLVQGWMWHGNLAAAVCAGLQRPLAMAIRGLPGPDDDWRTRLVQRIGALLARRAQAVVYNSRTAFETHRHIGYPGTTARVISNGVDTTRFVLDPERREHYRRAWGTDAGQLVIGRVARIDPRKDHITFLRAARLVARDHPDTVFVLVGTGFEAGNGPLIDEIKTLGLSERVRLLGAQHDIVGILSAFDIFCSSSRSESFPNVVAEAMATGLPVVATAVGDSARLVGPVGRIVPPSRPEALGAALSALAEQSPGARRSTGRRARSRVVRQFDLAEAVERYHALYADLLARPR